ncbi:MAG: T9SS type A sorting domain-containing protein [Elusimicrobiota bacterium]
MKKLTLFLAAVCFLAAPVLAGWSLPKPLENNQGQATFPQIVIGSDDRPHIAYYNDNQNEIRYMKKVGDGLNDWDGPGVVESSDLGYISLALDSSNNGHISYITGSDEVWYTYYNGNSWVTGVVQDSFAGQQMTSIVWYTSYYYLAYKNNTTVPNGLRYGDSRWWITNDVDTIYANTGKGVSMATNGTDLIASYYSYDGGSSYAIRCRYHTLSDSFGNWYDHPGGHPVDNTSTQLGEITALALDDTNHWPHIVYVNYNAAKVIYTYYNGSGWSTPQDVAYNAGNALVDIDVKKPDEPHIVFYNTNEEAVKYAYKEGSVWKLETIDDTVGNYNSYGLMEKKCPSIKLDSSGKAHVAYHSVNNNGTVCYSQQEADAPEIYGNVTDADGHGIQGVDMELTGSENDNTDYASVTTDSYGYYQFSRPTIQTGWYYKVTPTKTDYGFNPSSQYINMFATPLQWDFTGSEVSEDVINLQQEDEIIVGNNRFDPNDSDPAKRKCRIMYNLSHDQSITIRVFDLAGNLVRTIVENETRTEGINSADEWDGTNVDYDGVASGIYYIVVEGDSWQITRKIAIVKERR